MRTLPPEVAPDVAPDRFPLITLDDDALSASLRQWRAVMGTEWWGTPGTAAMHALEARIKAVKTWHARWRLPDGPYKGGVERVHIPAQFDRRPDCRCRYLHAYDVTRMFPTAAGCTDVALGALQPGPREFDKSLAGWWLVDIAPWCWDELPDPAGYASRHHRPGDPRWVTTPTLRLLADLHDQGAHGGFSVVMSFVGKGRPVFKAWNQAAEQLYRAAVTRELRDAVKMSTREAIGLLNSSTYSTSRPDWHFAVIAQARSNLFRKLWKVYGSEARAPLAIDTDCVWYGSDNPDPVASLPDGWVLGDMPGQFKVKGTVTR